MEKELLKEIKRFRELSGLKNNINEGFVDNIKKIGVAAALISSLYSCKKEQSLTKQDMNTDTTTVTPKDTSDKPINMNINGTWYPEDKCRKDLWEHFVISDDYFDWFVKGFNDTIPTRWNNIKNLKNLPDSELNNEESYYKIFEIKNNKIFFYQRINGTREVKPVIGVPTDGFNLYVNPNGELIFDMWRYTRK